MLKQILSDMYVDPELLAELSEEQKQILFFKMRQEQIRRWKERDAGAAPVEEGPRKQAMRKDYGKSVQWKLGADGEVWVWVMGEHLLDKPYDLLCAEITAERERRPRLWEAAAAPRCPREAFAEPSVASPLHVPLDTNLASEVERSHENRLEAEMQKGQTEDTQRMTPMNQSQMQGDGAINPVKESMQSADQEDPIWLESLRQSKAADERRRSLAKHARDDYKRLSLQGRHKSKAMDPSRPFKNGEQRRLLPPPPLPPKPKTLPVSARLANGPPARKQAVQRSTSSSTQESIIQWFKEEQLHLRAGFEKAADRVAPWFHGILTTKKAEELLSNSVPGTFLIRVSEKIKGYVLSYLSAEGYKHFLIDSSGESYSFLGVDQLEHPTLADLVDYHKEEPITSLGKEQLLYPCGQQGQEPDYLDLFK